MDFLDHIHLKKKKKRRSPDFLLWPLVLFVLVGLGFALFTLWNRPQPRQDIAFGVTYSVNYVEEFGLDWREVYDSIIDELQVKHLRLPIYWNQIEPLPDRFDFRKFDYMIKRAEEAGVKLIVVVGRRLPRWPECHEPAWVARQVEPFKQKRILNAIEKAVKRYVDSPAIVTWQVDNEPFLTIFGECPPPDKAFVESELALVKRLDPSRPTMLTESGELSTWLNATQLADQVGISMYRITWNQYFGYWYYPLSPNFYKRKAQLISPLTDRVIVTELQAEPWTINESIDKLPLPEQYKSMNPERLAWNIDFVRRTQIDEAYLWGAEWWYWLKETHGDTRMWEAAKALWMN